MLLVSLVNAVKPVVDKTKPQLNSFCIEPFSYNDQSVLYLDCAGSSSKQLIVSVFVFNDLYPDGIKIYSEVVNKKEILTFSYDNKYTREKNEVEICYGTLESGINSARHEIWFNSPTKKSITDIDKIQSVIPCLIFTPSGGWNQISFNYNLQGFDSLYIPTFYHKLDLSDFKISMPSVAFSMFNTKAYLFVSNYNAEFFKDKKNWTIDLSIEKGSNNIVSFKPLTPLYVNVETLEMSPTKNKNYVKTNHFYLPRNEFKNQNDYNFSLVLEDFGPDKSTYVHVFKFNALLNIVGDCVNSEYCILRS